MLICQNAEGVHGKQKVGNPWSKPGSPNYGPRANPTRQDISSGSRRQVVNNEKLSIYKKLFDFVECNMSRNNAIT